MRLYLFIETQFRKNFANQSPPKSFFLINLHKHLFGSPPIQSHGAKADYVTVLRTSAMFGKEWFKIIVVSLWASGYGQEKPFAKWLIIWSEWVACAALWCWNLSLMLFSVYLHEINFKNNTLWHFFYEFSLVYENIQIF